MSFGLDNIHACVEELSAINVEVAGFAHEWARDAGDLKEAEKVYERLSRAAMRATSGKNADERAATVQVAISEVQPDLLERMEKLAGKVESHKTRFKSLERRSSNAQSILAAHRDMEKLTGYVPREALAMANKGNG